MKTSYLSFPKICTALVVGCLLACSNRLAAQSQNISPANPEIADIFSNAPPTPVGYSSPMDYLKSFANEIEVSNAYHEGKISKEESIFADTMLRNKKEIDFYGRVIDQSGQPVVSAKVRGIVKLGFGDTEERDTMTDSDGLFHFLDLHGQGLAIRLQKQGYQASSKIPFQMPDNYWPDSAHPAEISMWKSRGSEPMIHDRKLYGIRPNGTVFTINLVSKKKVAGESADGDLLVRLERPAQLKPKQKFDWKFEISAVNGGLIEATNADYLNEAPESGYEPSYQIDMSATNQNWREQVGKTFYFKSRNGHVFGHFDMTVIPDYNGTAAFRIDSYVNPAGSRDLEFDP